MNQQTTLVTIGSLLHDVGKLCYRAGSGEKHSAAGYHFLKNIWPDASAVLDCVRWHHSAELREAKAPADSLAYIAWAADNISAAADRRTVEEGHFDRGLPLSPVFTRLNGVHPGKALSPKEQDGILRLPVQDSLRLTAGDYASLCARLESQLKALPPKEEWINSLLVLLEALTSTVPSSTNTGESPDISLFDHAKITAAAAACISEYLRQAGITDYRAHIWKREADFRAEQVFLLYSADFSGIQKFIYTVSNRNALKSLRSRSFFLELAMEHYIDELLAACGVSRANLLYSGGGHCYILLPNTQAVIDAVNGWNHTFNDWLVDEFGVRLYLADGYTPCCANDLTNTPAEEAPYKAMFRRVSSQVAKKKLHRYTAQQILRMNREQEDSKGRECRICGRTDSLTAAEDGKSICPWCRCFEELSPKIQARDVYLVCRGEDKKADFTLPSREGEVSFSLTNEASAKAALREREDILRVYTKNTAYVGLKYSTRIYVGDYAASNSMEELAKKSEGIRRLAVCRMDVDDLGQAFVAGFEQPQGKTPAEQQHFVTISRTAAFSRQMSLFFKCYINQLLDGSFGKTQPYSVAIVYSGGDDVFLVGSWNGVMKAALLIRNTLSAFTCGALTISAGIGLFDDHFPIRMAAMQTAELEEEAKQLPGKNGISLFGAGQGHLYDWDTFGQKVLKEKLAVLKNYFDSEQAEHRMAFLYNLMELLRQAQADPKQKIQLARYAYVLARLEPARDSRNHEHYKRFASDMYRWSLNPQDRGQLITAIYLYVYSNRKRKEDEK